MPDREKQLPATRTAPQAPTFSLTFDDGPDERWTPCVLSALRRCRTSATFFMVAERLRATPWLARAVLDAGGDVQLHCDRHIRHTELSEAEIEMDTCAALEVFTSAGVRPRYWRTPWGVQTDATARVARRHRLTLIRWTIDTHDWRGDPASTMMARARPELRAGGVVLMHDALGPGARRDGCENTLALLATLIDEARARGLGVGALPPAPLAPATAAPATTAADIAMPQLAPIGGGA